MYFTVTERVRNCDVVDVFGLSQDVELVVKVVIFSPKNHFTSFFRDEWACAAHVVDGPVHVDIQVPLNVLRFFCEVCIEKA